MDWSAACAASSDAPLNIPELRALVQSLAGQQAGRGENDDEELPEQEQRDDDEEEEEPQEDSLTLNQIKDAQRQFAIARDWDQFHTPRNLIMALVGEVGELAEIFQWKGEVAAGLPEFSLSERVHLGEELSDVMLYLIRLADVCGVDMSQAVTDKIRKNAAKYPADQCRGRSDKYTTYVQCQVQAEQARPREVPGIIATAPIPVAVTLPAVTIAPGIAKASRTAGTASASAPAAAGGCSTSADRQHATASAAPAPSYHVHMGDDMGLMSSAAAVAAAVAAAAAQEAASKRKRFNDQQLEVLTELAQQYNWSLCSVSEEDKDRLSLQYGITKERMQNFFNNRKPKDRKRMRAYHAATRSGGGADSGGYSPCFGMDLQDAAVGCQGDNETNDPSPMLAAAADRIMTEMHQHAARVHAAAAAMAASGGGVPDDDRGGVTSMQALLGGGRARDSGGGGAAGGGRASAPVSPSASSAQAGQGAEVVQQAQPVLMAVPDMQHALPAGMPMVLPAGSVNGHHPPPMMMDMQHLQQLHQFQMMQQQAYLHQHHHQMQQQQMHAMMAGGMHVQQQQQQQQEEQGQ